MSNDSQEQTVEPTVESKDEGSLESKLKSKYSPKHVIVINKNIYDVTDFKTEHPGGDDILDEYMYKDATDAFNGMGHSSYAERLLGKYLIGHVEGLEESFK